MSRRVYEAYVVVLDGDDSPHVHKKYWTNGVLAQTYREPGAIIVAPKEACVALDECGTSIEPAWDMDSLRKEAAKTGREESS